MLVYKKNIYSDNHNPIYANSISEYQRVMHWKRILKEFGSNIQHIYGVENILDETLSRP